jgi:hypothetical protein
VLRHPRQPRVLILNARIGTGMTVKRFKLQHRYQSDSWMDVGESYDHRGEAIQKASEYSWQSIIYGMLRVVDMQMNKVIIEYGAGSCGKPSYEEPSEAIQEAIRKEVSKAVAEADKAYLPPTHRPVGHVPWPVETPGLVENGFDNWWCRHWKHPIEVRAYRSSEIVVKARGELWSRKDFEKMWGSTTFTPLLETCPY